MYQCEYDEKCLLEINDVPVEFTLGADEGCKRGRLLVPARTGKKLDGVSDCCSGVDRYQLSMQTAGLKHQRASQ